MKDNFVTLYYYLFYNNIYNYSYNAIKINETKFEIRWEGERAIFDKEKCIFRSIFDEDGNEFEIGNMT